MCELSIAGGFQGDLGHGKPAEMHGYVVGLGEGCQDGGCQWFEGSVGGWC